jgi:hypothetical protein
VPAATPLPRGPSVLTLYSAEDLLTAPGCPVCRYASEASDRYLGWFALEGHAQPETITTLCGSLGMCSRHTRAIMGQPGASIRLTAVYRYLILAARERIARSGAPVAACPACLHDDAAAGRALETLLEGLADPEVMQRCRDLGGVCLPHLAAADGRRHRRAIVLLAKTLHETLAVNTARPGWLAVTDRDAETRLALRHALPEASSRAPGACTACLAAAQAERSGLARLPDLTRAGGPADQALSLCAGHLADGAVALSSVDALRALLRWQAACLETGRRASRGPSAVARSLTVRRRVSSGDCFVCGAMSQAAEHELGRTAQTARTAHQRHDRQALCVRHHLALRHSDKEAGMMLAPASLAAADLLIRELGEARETTTRARNNGHDAPDSTAWRRAAIFLDGSVLGGGSPSPR